MLNYRQVDCIDGYQIEDDVTSIVYGCDGGGLWHPTPQSCTGKTDHSSSQSEQKQMGAPLSSVSFWPVSVGSVFIRPWSVK